MSPEVAGIVGIVVLILVFLLRVPVAFAMALVGLVGFAYLSGAETALSLLARDIFDKFTSYPLSAIPMFILMGSFAFAAGISRRLFDTAYYWVGQYRGGLTMATVLGCAGFAAVCGSSTATAATMGKVALPEMKRYNYDDKLATGTVAAAGTLGVLIPPSTILLVYGYLTQESIGKLFIAGLLPGILLSAFFVATVFFICLRNPASGPPGAPTSWRRKAVSLTGVIEAMILFGLVIGGLFAGWFSPTKAGAIGAAGALVIGLVRREISWRAFWEASKDAVRTSCMVLFIITGAVIFGHFMAISKIPFVLADWIAGLPLPPMGVIGVIALIFFIGGFFMDAMALIVLLVPIIFPVLIALDVDLIWFGVIIVLVGEMGVITPPVGVNVFVIKGIAPDIPIETIFKGIFPFLAALIICTIILIAFPQIATFLPSYITY
ncbi:MAG: TRAP transporter large permease subunit [Dehalococcoidales bacterium]|nr:TRAP transporter large permease subunit [Dehalococcoidales bacterium]